MAEQNNLSELDQLAYDAYKADCQAQGIFVQIEWRDLNPLTQKRYRAIAHQIRGHSTNGFLSAVQLESSLIASLAIVEAELKRYEGNDLTASYYRSRGNALTIDCLAGALTRQAA